METTNLTSFNDKYVIKTQVDQKRYFNYILYSDNTIDVYQINNWDNRILQNITIRLNESITNLKKCYDLKFQKMSVYVDCQLINEQDIYRSTNINTVFITFPVYS